jgi:hypothetical protein
MKRCAAILCFSAMAAAPALYGQMGLGLSPMRVDLKAAPGEVRSGSVLLTNESAEKLRARGEILDFMIDANDTIQFQRNIDSESAFSCRQWLSLNPMEAEVPPQSQQMVRYTLRVPPSVTTGSFHCAAGYTSVSTAEQMTEAGVGLRMAVRVVVVFYVVTGNPQIEGGIKEIKAEPVADPPSWLGVVVLNNPGAMHYRPSGELTLLDRDGKVLETQPFNPLPVLPKREQRFLFKLTSQIDPGEYQLRARVDLGTNEIQEGTVKFEVPAADPAPAQ